MKTVTDIDKSKVLAKILPLESADMSWVEKGNAKRTWYDAENRRITTKYEKKYYIPCWSLAALLDVLPKIINNETLFIETSAALWHIGYRNIYTARSDNLIDACYEMVIKLHKDGLL